MKKAWLIVIPAILTGILVIGIMNLFTHKPIKESCAPGSYKHNQNTNFTYCLTMLKSEPLLALHKNPSYKIYIGKALWSDANYGTFINYPFDRLDSKNEAEAKIKDLQVTWTDNGVGVKAENGREIFIPASDFIGGR